MPRPLVQSTGRRKRAVARVRVRPGTGHDHDQQASARGLLPERRRTAWLLTEPLRLTETDETYDIDATIHGGGITGQAGALRLGISRALIALDPELAPALKEAGFLTRDSREKESKKYGLKKARKAPQYSKR